MEQRKKYVLAAFSTRKVFCQRDQPIFRRQRNQAFLVVDVFEKSVHQAKNQSFASKASKMESKQAYTTDGKILT
jgi:hypothetical protein